MTPEEAEEFRQDMLAEDTRDAQHECLMRPNDIEESYFTDYVANNTDILEALTVLKGLCATYDRDLDDELDILKDLL